MIYLRLTGRIGNQLFMYAMAESIRQRRGLNEKIIICDKRVLDRKWENSLPYYGIPNVQYLHSFYDLPLKQKIKAKFVEKLYEKLDNRSYNSIYNFENRLKRIFTKFGLVLCENGFIDFPTPSTKDVYISGYFQSEKFFYNIKQLLINNLKIDLPNEDKYTNLISLLKTRNSVCISIKVEHNIGSSLYDVCNMDYYKSAIKYIIEIVENPLFFICSDNVQYVVENLIDTNNVDYVCQDLTMGVHENLHIMSLCKHFILSNSSYAWWGQYLSNNRDKIVIAPNHWMRVSMPIDIYDDSWHLIDVSDFVNIKLI